MTANFVILGLRITILVLQIGVYLGSQSYRRLVKAHGLKVGLISMWLVVYTPLLVATSFSLLQAGETVVMGRLALWRGNRVTIGVVPLVLAETLR
jgi:hypothetical protein